MKTKQNIKKVSIVVNSYNTEKNQQQKDPIFNGYIFERNGIQYGLDLKSTQREVGFGELVFNDNIKKYRVLSLFISKLNKKLNKEILSSNDIEEYIDNLIMNDLKIDKSEVIKHYK